MVTLFLQMNLNGLFFLSLQEYLSVAREWQDVGIDQPTLTRALLRSKIALQYKNLKIEQDTHGLPIRIREDQQVHTKPSCRPVRLQGTCPALPLIESHIIVTGSYKCKMLNIQHRKQLLPVLNVKHSTFAKA